MDNCVSVMLAAFISDNPHDLLSPPVTVSPLDAVTQLPSSNQQPLHGSGR